MHTWHWIAVEVCRAGLTLRWLEIEEASHEVVRVMCDSGWANRQHGAKCIHSAPPTGK